MKKTRGHYPYKQVLRLNGLKIVGKADKDELEILLNIIIEDIMSQNSNLLRDDLNNHFKNLKIYFCEQLPRFSGARGSAIGKKIFINKEILDLINSHDLNLVRESESYKTIFHEAIHFIQTSSLKKRFYNGLDLKGMIEGATEKETIETISKKRSTILTNAKYNFQTDASPYVPYIIIMQQLETLYGRELMQDFTFNLNHSLLDKMKNDLGLDLTRRIIKYCSTSQKRQKESLENLQNEMMHLYFDKRVNQVINIEEAERLLSKLKNLGTKRLKKFDSNEYEKYYKKILSILQSRIVGFNVDKHINFEPKFYENSTLEDKKMEIKEMFISMLTEKLQIYLFESEPIPRNSNELVEKFENFNFNNFKYYESLSSNTSVAVWVLEDGSFNLCSIISQKDKQDVKFSRCGKIENGHANIEYKNIKFEINLLSNSIVLKTSDNMSEKIIQESDFKISKIDAYKMLLESLSCQKLFNKKTNRKFKSIPSYEEYCRKESRMR